MQTIHAEHHGPTGLTRSSNAAVLPLPRGNVHFSDSGFLGSWQELNRAATIPHCIQQIEASGAVDNFRRLIGESLSSFRGPPFADSDVYKTLEAIAWEIGRTGTSDYDVFVDEVVSLLGRAQAEDGYLNTWVQGGTSDQKLSAMRWSHELYCLGHLIQAAIAFARTTGRCELLEIAIGYVDLVERELGPGARAELDGHPEIETALVEMWRLTGERRFLELARHFIDRRGYQTMGPDQFGADYFLDHEPIREATEAVGHAVRQLYLTAGATDLMIEEGDFELGAALERIWLSVHQQKMYITGGLGSRHRGESFGDAYELPPDRAYSETCAGIANFMWNWRMLLLTGEARFADEMERGLYNVIAASTSMSGTEFFYVNRLQVREGHISDENASSIRRSWFGCACCPPNLARLIASLDSYAATSNDRGVQVHLYSDGNVALGCEPDSPIAAIRTDYPWDGRVSVTLDRPLGVELRLRVPAWVEDYSVTIDGAAAGPAKADGYLVFEPNSVNHSIELDFHATPVIDLPHPYLDASRGTMAVRNGPIVYAFEQADLPDGVDVQDVYLPFKTQLEVVGAPDGLDVPAIIAKGGIVRRCAGGPLYSNQSQTTQEEDRELGPLTLIPYFRWGNRSQAAMRVWIPGM
ncbi:hypothetical protein AS189_18530 [Arthrobacter alpinus]|uniref:Glycoside hydrolase family 127 protein n=1 Tax=Arthrobacter alpinus TaxID=656366 RepID=A0A0S2M310_9MICC|nr:beta-L-arabinofuranosidase domain-containing protein [Arthrobacter alpinus]ALO68125.1 hypothetical protein AS189_18530 [Arthrobacter alpinus]